jgi:branched-chain amino acid aminotransferase
MAENNVYINGRVVLEGEAKLDASDAGLLHGASVFETLRAHNGRAFRLDRHLRRLFATVAHLGLRTDATPESLAAGVADLLAANALAEARIRITLTPGGVHAEKPTTIITAEAMPRHPAEWYAKGVMVTLSPYRQAVGDPTCGHKTGCYLPRLLAMQDAASRGAAEALWYTPDGRLAEACFSSVFLVCGGQVFTPPLDTPILPGTVRSAVIELCGPLGLACRDDAPLDVKAMLAAEEVFLSSSVAGIRPVARIEKHAVGEEKPGPVTLRIMSAYAELLDRECAKGNDR